MDKDSTAYFILSRLKQSGVRPVFSKGVPFVPDNKYADSIIKYVPCSEKQWKEIEFENCVIPTRTVWPKMNLTK